MENRWSDERAAECIATYGEKWGEDLALRLYVATLIGAEECLVLHGGGNASVKTTYANIFGEIIPAIFVKASGFNMASSEPEGYVRLDLEYLRRLRTLEDLSDEDMIRELRTHLLESRGPVPSIETLVHAFIPEKFVDHTHADAILALTNQPDGEDLVREALGSDVSILGYVRPGFKLARAAAVAYDQAGDCRGMVWMRHGLLTWGSTARQSYEASVELINRAEAFIARRSRRPLIVASATPVQDAGARYARIGPLIRGLLARPSGGPDDPFIRSILVPLITREVLDFVDSDRGKEFALSPPLTSDHLIRTKALPLWVEAPDFREAEELRTLMADAIAGYCGSYDAYVSRHAARMPGGISRLDSMPRVILMPGVGAICAGKDVHAARIVRDVTAHTLAVKSMVAAMGTYLGIPEAELFDMEYRGLQHAKLGGNSILPLSHHVALVTGAAGAIGAGVAEVLLEQGCHVALTDLPGERLDSLVAELRPSFGERVMGAPLDVTAPESVAAGFAQVISAWGGVDVVIVNAGLAHVSSLAEMQLEEFRRLERINLEGTLLVLAESARHFRLQGTGGDIVLVSTKNVFSPGANFGAYSATKSGAHQLARIASLELAELGVRVNMVSPDAVFGDEGRRSGLWAAVGPGRMRARGLDEQGLEEYYRNRNLLKARVTARHVGNAVLYFATRRTPTTGATLPVDGGLPDATPR